MRLTDHEHVPIPSAKGELRFGELRRSLVTDGQGVADVWVPADVAFAEVRWVCGSRKATRELVNLYASDEPRHVGPRLHNLGYNGDSEDERMLAYRVEHGYPDDLPDDVIRADVVRWHDGGARPPHASLDTRPAYIHEQPSSDNTPALVPLGGKVKPGVNTVCSNIVVDLLRDKKGYAPYKKFHARKKKSKKPVNLWALTIYKGQHSAISFDDFPKADKIYSGNAINAVPNRKEEGFFNVKEGKRRHIFFHGWYMGKKSGNQVSMLSIRKGCDIFQIRTHDWPTGTYGLIELYGKSMALNASDIPVAYNLTVSKRIGKTTAMAEVVKMIEKELPLTHLVLSAHGSYEGSDGSDEMWSLELGSDGLHRINSGEKTETVSLFSKLKDKVRYIWLMSCAVGGDHKLMRRLAENTNAYVIAHGLTVDNVNVPRGMIDWQPGAVPKLWNHSRRDTSDPSNPIPLYLLWEVARRAANPHDFKKGLDFNLVRLRKGSKK